MITGDDIGGVHIKYLHHCRRQCSLQKSATQKMTTISVTCDFTVG